MSIHRQQAKHWFFIKTKRRESFENLLAWPTKNGHKRAPVLVTTTTGKSMLNQANCWSLFVHARPNGMRTKSPGSSKALPVNEYYLLCFWIGAAVCAVQCDQKGPDCTFALAVIWIKLKCPRVHVPGARTTQANKISCQAHNRSHQSWRCLPFMWG